VHIPLQDRRDELERCKMDNQVREIYCSMMVEMDDAVGEMTKQLKALELWENTLVLVMTDNGGCVSISFHPPTLIVFELF
jgi:arylsulfatase A-like enzyme